MPSTDTLLLHGQFFPLSFQPDNSSPFAQGRFCTFTPCFNVDLQTLAQPFYPVLTQSKFTNSGLDISVILCPSTATLLWHGGCTCLYYLLRGAADVLPHLPVGCILHAKKKHTISNSINHYNHVHFHKPRLSTLKLARCWQLVHFPVM